MSLKLKLARLGSAGPGSTAGEAPPAPDAAYFEPLVAGDEAVLPGELRQTPHGSVHVVDRYYEPHHCHGRVPVGGALEAGAEVVSALALDVGLAAVDPRRMLLLDTETTGLSGGMGTVPFLVGLGWFEDQSLRVQQFLLRQPGDEAPMLQALAERLAWASCIVSYNGKSFDWPLVRNRYVLHRVPLPTAPPHLDLLHCARRIYRRRLARLKLVDLETELFDMHREGDVPGWAIPAIYFRYLRDGDPTGLSQVVEHNAHDLVALAALLAQLAEGFRELRRHDDPRDHLSYAEVAARAGDEARAWEFARAAAEGGGEDDCSARAWLLCARLARRRGDVNAEQAALEQAAAVAADEATAAEAHLALAKLHEHRRRDYACALAHAPQALLLEGEEANARRVARLTRKAAF
jgi:uncharacterized protein